jgi:hypothetical protein
MCCVTARDCPPHAAQPAYLSSLAKEGWAWEYLRRNETYRRVASGRARMMEKVAEIGTAPVYRLRSIDQAAEAWSLCSFRRSRHDGRDG